MTDMHRGAKKAAEREHMYKKAKAKWWSSMTLKEREAAIRHLTEQNEQRDSHE